MNKDFWKIPWLSNDEKVRLHILYISCIRFVVEKYGGVMDTDCDIRIASIKIPKGYTAACFQELEAMDLVKPNPVPEEQALSL